MKTAIKPIHRPYNFQDGRQFSQALFTKVEHSDRSDEGLGSRLRISLEIKRARCCQPSKEKRIVFRVCAGSSDLISEITVNTHFLWSCPVIQRFAMLQSTYLEGQEHGKKWRFSLIRLKIDNKLILRREVQNNKTWRKNDIFIDTSFQFFFFFFASQVDRQLYWQYAKTQRTQTIDTHPKLKLTTNFSTNLQWLWWLLHVVDHNDHFPVKQTQNVHDFHQQAWMVINKTR